LRGEGHGRADAQRIARQDDEVEVFGDADDPVQLGQRVVEIRDEKDSQLLAPIRVWFCIMALETNPMGK
jgi:hypothetical protein